MVEVSAKKEIMYPKKNEVCGMVCSIPSFKLPYQLNKCREKYHLPHPPRKTGISDSSRNQLGCPTHRLPNISSTHFLKKEKKIRYKSGLVFSGILPQRL